MLGDPIHLTRSAASRGSGADLAASPTANPGGHAGVTVQSRTRLMMDRSLASLGAEKAMEQ
jgi:hypothetical protein